MNDDFYFFIYQTEIHDDPSVYGQLFRVFVEAVTEDNIHADQLVFEFEIVQTTLGDQIRIDYIPHGSTANTIPNFLYCAYMTARHIDTLQYRDLEEDFKVQLLQYVTIRFGSDLQEQIDTLVDM